MLICYVPKFFYHLVLCPRRLWIVSCDLNSFYQVWHICYVFKCGSKYLVQHRLNQLVNSMFLEKLLVRGSTISNNAYHLKTSKLQHSYYSPNDIHNITYSFGKSVMNQWALIILLPVVAKCAKGRFNLKICLSTIMVSMCEATHLCFNGQCNMHSSFNAEKCWSRLCLP